MSRTTSTRAETSPVAISDAEGVVLIGRSFMDLLGYDSNSHDGNATTSPASNDECLRPSQSLTPLPATQVQFIDQSTATQPPTGFASNATGTGNNLAPRSRQFVPTWSILGTTAAVPVPQAAQQTNIRKGRDNYQGTITDFDVRNATMPGDQNCSIFLTNINSSVCYDLKLLFNLITTGKVFAFHLNTPLQRGNGTCAATLTFMDRQGADGLMNALSGRGIWINGDRIRGRWARNIIGPSDRPWYSRVVHFRGPFGEFSLQALQSLLGQNMYYDLVDSRVWNTPAYTIVEMQFGSVRAQAESAKMCFDAHFQNNHRYASRWARDPCSRF